ncbi:MAG TPA: ATP-grasp domain-containing protein [Spirochaetia bacterium]|nr:ATP-grasp domain-containing protein [Spirochaetales bacterium]HRS64715.1 ATP-grasp domain-containing protein [Spirochaetia bacterium]HOT59445.1 ATP-grasp domain-containing protein [Spirochaetales bacterium]HPD80528.1 ATP-grasp domain-containing protein [Spirochaetales bacterium]HQK34658.1 ATP-grasp domain-containing protein [Spirochaetales bacterium]
MKAVLILGAGVMQGPAIYSAKQKGYRVYVADANAHALHAGDADVFLAIDLKDKDALLEAAKKIENLTGVFTAGTDFSASVAWIAEKLGLPGISYETAIKASNKAAMRRCLKEAGVPVPAFCVIRSIDELGNAISSFSSILRDPQIVFPLVVKPVDNMGARGCRAVATFEELVPAVSDALRYSRSGEVILEEYIEGPEFSLDALVLNDTIVIRGIADRHIEFFPFFVEMGHTMPSLYPQDVLDEVIDVFKRGIKAIGITRGAAKGDIKFSKAGASIGEIAARLSGGYMSGWTYPGASGINVTSEALDIACGQNIVLNEETYNRVSAERACISIPGIAANIENNATAYDYVFTRIQPGDTVVFPTNNVEKCGNVIVTRDSRSEAEALAEEAARNIIIRLKPNIKETDDFLANKPPAVRRTADGTIWPPDAFTAVDAMVLAMAESMPDILRDERPVKTIGIAPIYTIHDQKARDWQGRTISESLEIIQKYTGARLTKDADLVLGRIFWKALFRGGYQAGMYIIDSMLAKRNA